MGIIADSQALLKWLRSQDVPADGYYHVYRDDRDGVVDYATRINPLPIPGWADQAGKIGFGLGRFGYGPFGTGDAGGLGFGLGAFGWGLFGWCADLAEFHTPALADGMWRFGILGFDAAGNAAGSGTEVDVVLAGTPAPPGVPTASSYDDDTDTLTLAWSLSPDDEG